MASWNLTAGEAEPGDSLELAGQLVLPIRVPESVRDFVSENKADCYKGRHVTSTSSLYMHVHTHAHEHVHMHTHPPTNMHHSLIIIPFLSAQEAGDSKNGWSKYFSQLFLQGSNCVLMEELAIYNA